MLRRVGMVCDLIDLNAMYLKKNFYILFKDVTAAELADIRLKVHSVFSTLFFFFNSVILQIKSHSIPDLCWKIQKVALEEKKKMHIYILK